MPERIGAILPRVVKDAQRRHGTLADIQTRWRRLVGRSLAAHTRPVSVRRGRLVVHVDRPGDSYALSFQRAALLARLRDATDGHIEELVVRPGEISPAAGRRHAVRD